MSVYNLSDNGKKRVRMEYYRLLLLIVFPLVIILLIPTFALLYQHEHTIFSLEFIEPILILLSVIIVSVLFASWNILRQVQSLQFTINETLIVQEQIGKPTKTILRSDVSQLIEVEGKGIEVRSSDISASIFIPNDVENVDRLKLEIYSLAPLTSEHNQPDRKKLKLILIIFPYAILLTIYYLTGNAILGIILGLMIILSIIYTLITKVRSMINTRKKEY
ncbi:MAG: hypothetical protein NTX44_00025 [Ignavibacteriales bacterium]|nr:hypothetical protein [Ignavibacteriales bacterium]